MKGIVPTVAVLLVMGCNARSSNPPTPPAASTLDGQWDYVGTLKGQASTANGRFVFLFGPPADTATMVANAGTYTVAHDTASARILYSTVPANVGTSFRWTVTGWSGDTASYVVLNDSGRVTSQGRALRHRP